MPEENNVNFTKIEKIDIEELENLIEDFPGDEPIEDFLDDENLVCDCLNFGFDGDYGDLLNLLYAAKVEYISSKNKYEQQEVDLWLNTNFEEVMDRPKLTLKEKEMYAKKCLLPLKLIRDLKESEYETFKRMYELSLKYSLEVLR